MFNHHKHEAPGDRLLLVQMEARPNYASGHRHIEAYVIRRACADVPLTDNPEQTQTYYDGKSPIGYRTANWHVGNDRKSPLYTADLKITGQIDAYMPGHKKIVGGGAPYGGDVRFTPHYVEFANALAMANTFRRYEAFRQKAHLHGNMPEFKNDFFKSCFLIWTFLDLKSWAIRIRDCSDGALSNPLGFVELPWAVGLDCIQSYYLDEFAVKPAPAEASGD